LAAAGAEPAKHDATMTAVAPNARIVWIIKPSLLSQAFRACPATHTSSCTQFSPAFEEVAEMLFSIIVK
jgi:hypothetical protein